MYIKKHSISHNKCIWDPGPVVDPGPAGTRARWWTRARRGPGPGGDPGPAGTRKVETHQTIRTQAAKIQAGPHK